ncbi:hypothetical protein [Fodinibius sediminis]|uniref:Uncharacterized protein n=1 Tax=Fodinibius sediminis TaxID=1214077 RepID=A0A521EY95_9BACT|nr:hypothetical protein [Fodinibius sediminis]SMO88865.1 hypothetical protein SAMN06265218_12034 [Fodinibius sediminis]
MKRRSKTWEIIVAGLAFIALSIYLFNPAGSSIPTPKHAPHMDTDSIRSAKTMIFDLEELKKLEDLKELEELKELKHLEEELKKLEEELDSTVPKAHIPELPEIKSMPNIFISSM